MLCASVADIEHVTTWCETWRKLLDDLFDEDVLATSREFKRLTVWKSDGDPRHLPSLLMKEVFPLH